MSEIIYYYYRFQTLSFGIVFQIESISYQLKKECKFCYPTFEKQIFSVVAKLHSIFKKKIFCFMFYNTSKTLLTKQFL